MLQTCSGSPAWKSVLKARNMLQDGFSFRFSHPDPSSRYSNRTLLCPLRNNVSYIEYDSQVTLMNVFTFRHFDASQMFIGLPFDLPHFLSQLQHVIFYDDTSDCPAWSHCLDGRYTTNAGGL